MSAHSAQELIDLLNRQDECTFVEAKEGRSIDKSALESACAFSNEPDLGGGYILLGVSIKEEGPFRLYFVSGVDDPDKLQKDLATQCAIAFDKVIRPRITVESVEGKNVLKAFVPELPKEQKPLYFKKIGLPSGAYRRIGSTDQRCTTDDMHVFYQSESSYDSTVIPDSSMEDVDEVALKRYRSLREKVNPAAEELTYTDEELLSALGCMKEANGHALTLAGLHLFGKRSALRRLAPMIRADYIRVPGNEWVQDPENRFRTIDMVGPLLLLVYRLIEAVNADLPKGFLLEEGKLQADSIGLPVKVLREAIVNALMHRSYRVNRPVQVIRYDNRLEIINPGFSLKPEEQLGTPGSETRNPFIAAVFHETNLAETKGTGIRTMRRLLKQAHLAPPTFESSRSKNTFSVRLLLHHFLSEYDIEWLKQFEPYNLNDFQKQALIFVREVGAIDNSTYRQLSNRDTLNASTELRALRDFDLLTARGKGKGTYYIPGSTLNALIEPGKTLIEPVEALIEPVEVEEGGSIRELSNQLPAEISDRLDTLGKRTSDKEGLRELIILLCKWKPLSIKQLCELTKRSRKHLSHHYIKPLLNSGILEYTIPDMPNHPNQTYRTIKKEH
jgi:ATP-dependent DNA helicase RecG